MEWVIADDGTDCVRDIIESEETKEKLKGIKILYFHETEKMDLGKIRNYMHRKCSFNNDEDILVYMDDDDFYPPERVCHSVKKLMDNPQALAGGASELFLWFNTLNKMYKFGPYGPNHATAGTFAFKKELLKLAENYLKQIDYEYLYIFYLIWLNNYSNIFLHLYNKKNGVPGRKMGHLTFISDDDEELKILFKKVSDEISKGYI